MTVVSERDFYEWPMDNDEANCEDCGKEMSIPDLDNPNRGMMEPFWIKEKVEAYVQGIPNRFKAYCESCWSERIFNEVRS